MRITEHVLRPDAPGKCAARMPFSSDYPRFALHFAQRAFWAAAIRLRAAADNLRRVRVAAGLPAWSVRAAIAPSMRARVRAA